MKVLRAMVVCLLVDGLAALGLAMRGGGADARMLAVNVLVGVGVGACTAIVLGWAILRLHSLGYVLSVVIFLALLLATAQMANTDDVARAAELAVVASLYVVAAIITCLLVRAPQPVKPVRGI